MMLKHHMLHVGNMQSKNAVPTKVPVGTAFSLPCNQ